MSGEGFDGGMLAVRKLGWGRLGCKKVWLGEGLAVKKTQAGEGLAGEGLAVRKLGWGKAWL